MARQRGEPTRYPGIEKIDSKRFERGYGYRARADCREAGGGQPEKTFATVAEAREWQTDTEARAAQGTFVRKSTLTVRQAITAWLDGERGEENTHRSKRDMLKPAVSELGDRRVQSITKSDIDKLLRRLANGDIEGVQARAISYTNRTRSTLETIWEGLRKEGELTRNVVELVKPLTDAEAPEKPDAEPGANSDTIDPKRRLTDDEVRRLIDAHAPRNAGASTLKGPARRAERVRVRRGVFIALAMLGLRRGELAGLRWSAISDLDGDEPTLSMVRTRVPVEGGVEEKSKGKTVKAARTLLLPPETVTALRLLREMQADDRKRSGKRWKGDDDLALLTKDNGVALSPSSLDTWWHDSMEAAKIAGYRLHDMRHTAASRLLSAGVPLMDVATWLGHADGGVLALRVYGHTDPKDLHRAATALGRP